MTTTVNYTHTIIPSTAVSSLGGNTALFESTGILPQSTGSIGTLPTKCSGGKKKSLKRKSLKRKSLKRKSLKRKSLKRKAGASKKR